ncbi:antitoxin PaaA2 family protein [Pseudomonas sp. Eth.TT006]
MDIFTDGIEPHYDEESYKEWITRQVRKSIDDPRPSIPDEESRRLMAAKRELLRTRKNP